MSDARQALITALESALRACAARFGWTAEASPALLREPIGVRSLVQALATEESALPLNATPMFRSGLELRPGAIGLLICALDDATFETSYRAALWWAGLVRSELPASRRSDLHLFLVAPKGARDEASWHARRSAIESDERFCRKFVWLPSSTPSQEETAGLLDRTFLAQPWAAEAAEPSSLDPFERLAADADTPSLTPKEASRWVQRLGSADVVQRIADDLVAILEDEP